MTRPLGSIIVFGARGKVGERVIREALRRGHQVTAAMRGGALPDDLAGVPVVPADATDAEDVARAAAGHQVAVNAIGRSADDPESLIRAAQALLDGLGRAGVERLLVVGGSGSLLTEDGTRWIDSPEFNPAFRAGAMAQVEALEAYRSARGEVAWTYLSPPAMLAPGERTGRYRAGVDTLLRDEAGRSEISMEDLAVAILDELEQPEHLGRRYTVIAI